jgi:murein DD-endopeptidase MepM/ murein hydrolase activator NlpD
MRNKFMITISDVHGSRQYTLHQLVRRLALWIIISIVVLFAVGLIIIKALSMKVDNLDKLTSDLKNTQKVLAQENAKLEGIKSSLLYERKLLQQNITDKTNALHSMDNKLSEIEKIIGLEPDISDAFDDRAEAVKQKSWQAIKSAELSVEELSLLNKSVPTGYPLKTYKRISDGFGYRIHPITHKRVFHFGTDFAAKTGTPIYATADGVVAYARKNGGYGKFLLIYHPFGFSTAYGHLNKYAVKEGTYVYQGDLIGYVGNSGKSTGPHLHYEIRYLQKWLNPKSFLTWSEKNYLDIMKKERLVKWDNLLKQLHTRYALNNTISLKKR